MLTCVYLTDVPWSENLSLRMLARSLPQIAEYRFPGSSPGGRGRVGVVVVVMVMVAVGGGYGGCSGSVGFAKESLFPRNRETNTHTHTNTTQH